MRILALKVEPIHNSIQSLAILLATDQLTNDSGYPWGLLQMKPIFSSMTDTLDFKISIEFCI